MITLGELGGLDLRNFDELEEEDEDELEEEDEDELEEEDEDELDEDEDELEEEDDGGCVGRLNFAARLLSREPCPDTGNFAVFEPNVLDNTDEDELGDELDKDDKEDERAGSDIVGGFDCCFD